MSLYNKASIVLAAGAYKEGRIFNQKPLSEHSDLKFDRGTSAAQTREASDGNITSVGQDIPRIDYIEGEGHLLIEPQATNYATYSNDLTQSIYTKDNGGVGVLPIVTANYSTSPDGTQNASRLQCDLNGGNTSSDYSYIYNIGAVQNNNGNVSVYLKNNESGSKVVYFRNTFGTIDNVTVTESWQRFNISNADTRGLYLGLRGSYGNSDTCDISVYGIQIEDNTFATSLIPTSGGQVTRDTETAIDGGDSTMFNDDEGVLYIEAARFEGASYSGAIGVCDANANNSIYIIIGNTSVRGVVRASSNVYISSHNASNLDSFNKIAFQYKSGDSKIFFNGSQLGSTNTDTWSTNAPKIKLNFDRGDGTDPFQGKIKCIAVFKETLTDTELQELTS